MKLQRLTIFSGPLRRFFNTRTDLNNRMSVLFRPHNLIPQGMKVNEDEVSLSQRLLLDNGFIRQSSSGIFHYLPLGTKVLNKLINLVDASMNIIGGQRIEMPTLLSAHLWKKTGRWDEVGPELLKLTDRHNKEYCLAPTHEESVTQIFASISNLSYRNFPIRLYQITKKFRDEMKPRFGLLRAKEFIMKDMYSFDTNIEDAEKTYDAVCEAYADFFSNILNLENVKVLAASGSIGGSLSHEFHVKCDIGEDRITTCDSCTYGINEQLRVTKEETKCPNCGGCLSTSSAIELGHTFLLGTKYSKPIGATFLNSSSKHRHLQMGCFGIGVSRIIAAAVEVLSKGGTEIRWPLRIAPYIACIIPPKVGSLEENATKIAEELHNTLAAQNLFPNDIILDDRTELTIGKRSLESRKIGIPFVIIAGKQALLSEPQFEVQNIQTGDTVFMNNNDIISHFQSIKQQLA